MSIIFNQDNIIIWKDNAANATIEVLRAALQKISLELFSSSITHLPTGAPILETNPHNIHISISHTANFIALLYSSQSNCGIDIELNTRNAARVSRKFTNQEEVEIVKSYYPANPELLIWCAKEALYKMQQVEGAELKTDFKIHSASHDTLLCTAMQKPITVNYTTIDNLLITNTLCHQPL